MNSQDLKLQQTTRMLKPFEHLGEQPRPRSGWLRAIRTALGQSLRQHAARADLTYGTLFDAEKSEARETIPLAPCPR